MRACLMQIFRKRFRQPIRQSFGQDALIVIVVLGEFLRQLIRADASGDGKAADDNL